MGFPKPITAIQILMYIVPFQWCRVKEKFGKMHEKGLWFFGSFVENPAGFWHPELTMGREYGKL